MAFLLLASLANICTELIKEAVTKPLPEGSWANKELYMKDLASDMSVKEIAKQARKGRYYLPPEQMPKYPEPHRDKDGKIIIENCKLYDEDLFKYGAVQTKEWVRQGKYNLTPEELKKEEERIQAKIDRLINL